MQTTSSMKLRILPTLLVCACALLAQTNRGGISGTVSDKSGAVIPGASIVITNTGTNEVFRLKTSESGSYNQANLEPVVYTVEVEAQGFQKARYENVKVDTASTAAVNFELQTGSVQTEVTVSATAPLLNTESGTAGQTITEMQIDNAPLVNRSVLDLSLLVPNVTGDVGSEDPGVGAGGTVPGFNLSINGGRAGSSMIMADGVNNTGVGVARAVVSFSPETVQEFTVQTNAYSAEYGRTGGGVINTTTKSGSNQFHGTALWYQRNPATNAAPFTTAATNRPVSNTRNNQFSLTAGGPVIIPKLYDGRNKTFFFFGYEPRYLIDHVQVDGLMPTDAMRAGDFSNTVRVTNGDSVPVPASVAALFPRVQTTDATLYQYFTPQGNQLVLNPAPAAGTTLTPLPGNIIPKTMLDPVSLKLLQYVPAANSAYFLDPNGNLANLVLQRFLKDNNTRYTARVDHNITAKNRLTFRATVVPVVGITGYGSTVNGNAGNYSYSRQLMAADTHMLSPRIFNDLRLNYTRGRFSGTFAPQYDAKMGENLSTELGLPSLTHGGVPNMAIGLGSYGGIGAGGSTLGDNVEERYNVADAVHISRGAMSITVGVDLTHELLNTVNYYSAAGGIYNFRPYETSSTGTKAGTGGIQFASFLMGVPDAVTLSNALLPYYYRWNSGAAYVQDDWKVRPNLTINIGLRYSLQLPRTEKYNHQGTFLLGEAQSFPLATPLTLPATGQVITSALIPPFAMDGYGGRSRGLWPADYHDFEPRIAFAWSPRIAGVKGLVVRGGYGLAHTPLNGSNRQPLPNFSSPATTFGVNSGQVNPNYVMRLSSNPPYDPPLSWSQVLSGIPSDGLIFQNSINMASSGFAISANMKTPYVQNWNFTIAKELSSRDVIEVAYVGAKGTHLFLPSTNQNSTNLAYLQALDANNLSSTTTVTDPLGRIGTNGRVISIARGTLDSTYMGFNNLYTRWNSSADSIRHAAYINYLRRAARGLTVTANYTFGKSIDDASDSSVEANVLTTGSPISGGSASFGGTRRLDRSVSSFDVKHSVVTSILWDVPVGHGRAYFNKMPRAIDGVFGGWSTSLIERLRSGTPFMPVLHDNNGVGDTGTGGEYSIRPDIVSGVPLINPLWSSNCPLTQVCQPYINPAAFERPALGALGDSPRTLDAGRGPMQNFLDISVQKTFPVRERYRVQFRVDLLNALNHPIFGAPSGYGGSNSIFSGAPSVSALSAAQYNSWAAYNGKPLAQTAGDAGNQLLSQINGMVNGQKLPSGALPTSFFTVPLPTVCADESQQLRPDHPEWLQAVPVEAVVRSELRHPRLEGTAAVHPVRNQDLLLTIQRCFRMAARDRIRFASAGDLALGASFSRASPMACRSVESLRVAPGFSTLAMAAFNEASRAAGTAPLRSN